MTSYLLLLIEYTILFGKHLHCGLLCSCCLSGNGVPPQEQPEISWQSETNHMFSGQPAAGQALRLRPLAVQTWHPAQTHLTRESQI